jgi:hypothetical protein
MARLSSISLLFLFLINLIGGISLLLIQRHKRHETVEIMIASEAYRYRLTQLHISSGHRHEINWVEVNKEFRYQGDMYDLVRSDTLADGSIVYHCIADHEETNLYSEIESNLAGTPMGHHSDRLIVLQLFKFLSTFLDQTSQTRLNHLCATQKINVFYLGSFPQVNLPIPAQPPEVA